MNINTKSPIFLVGAVLAILGIIALIVPLGAISSFAVWLLILGIVAIAASMFIKL